MREKNNSLIRRTNNNNNSGISARETLKDDGERSRDLIIRILLLREKTREREREREKRIHEENFLKIER